MEEAPTKKQNEFASLLKSVIRKIPEYEKTEWRELLNSNPETKHIHLYEAEVGDGKFFLKAYAELPKCEPERLIRLNMDNCFETRKQWETDELMDIECLEQFVKLNLNIIRYRIRVPIWGVSNREFVALQWCKYNEKTNRHTLISCSVNYDEKFPPTETDYVRGHCISVLQVEKTDRGCGMVIYTHVDPGGWIPVSLLNSLTEWKEKLRSRCLLYEKVITKKFESIYTEWLCHKCNLHWNVHQEKCRHCKNARPPIQYI